MGQPQMVKTIPTPPGEHVLPPDESTPRRFLSSGQAVYEVADVSLIPMPAGRPSSMLFGALNDPILRIKKPFRVEISVEDDSIVASCEELEEFGYGESLSDALDDFGRTVRELYFSLESQRDQLSDNLERIRTALHQYLEPR